jgi:hypothetical protein
MAPVTLGKVPLQSSTVNEKVAATDEIWRGLLYHSANVGKPACDKNQFKPSWRQFNDY